MNASIDKSVVSLIVAGVVALGGLFLGSASDAAQNLVLASGILAAGVVYLQKYHDDIPYKAVWAAVIPLLFCILRFIQTGQIDEAEVSLALQALLGGIATYVAKRRLSNPVANREPANRV